jgi:hypothetical protein
VKIGCVLTTQTGAVIEEERSAAHMLGTDAQVLMEKPAMM